MLNKINLRAHPFMVNLLLINHQLVGVRHRFMALLLLDEEHPTHNQKAQLHLPLDNPPVEEEDPLTHNLLQQHSPLLAHLTDNPLVEEDRPMYNPQVPLQRSPLLDRLMVRRLVGEDHHMDNHPQVHHMDNQQQVHSMANPLEEEDRLTDNQSRVLPLHNLLAVHLTDNQLEGIHHPLGAFLVNPTT